jgi:hypothetical protein
MIFLDDNNFSSRNNTVGSGLKKLGAASFQFGWKSARLAAMSDEPEIEILTKSQFASEMQVGRPRISQLITMGMPTTPDNRVDVEQACRWIVANLDPLHGRGAHLWNRAHTWVSIFDLPAPARRSKRGRPENRA